MKGFFKDVLDGKVREVRKWIEKGQNVGLYDEYGNTSLHLAAEKGYRGVCKVLIDGGADVNQKNDSVGWTAVHYAAYEGHSDVLRMLIAHGAVPDVEDKSGDTAETYALEWQNMECLKILQEATALREATKAKSEYMYDSDDKTPSDDSDEDEDESSMMNWVIPPPSMPITNANLNKTSQLNSQTTNLQSKTVDNSTIDSTPTLNNKNNKSSSIQDSKTSSEEDIHLSIHLQMPTKHTQNKRNYSQSDSESLPDLTVEDTESVIYTGRKSDYYDDTESDDTLTLIKKSEEMKAAKEDTFRPNSIVDRIKNTLPSTSPPAGRQTAECRNEKGQPDIDKLLDSSTGDPEYVNVKGKMQKTLEDSKPNEVHGQRERSVARAFSQAKEILARERSRTRAMSQAKDTNVGRGQSHFRETAIPRELLPLADHIFSMSSATIPDDMTMSCGSIFEKFTNELEGSGTEKEILLKRLKELIEGEGSQINKDLKERKMQLSSLDESHKLNVNKLKETCTIEEENMIARLRDVMDTMEGRHNVEEERIQREIAKLEEELGNILAPSQLLFSLTATQKSPSVAKVAPAKPELNELEQELECCGCKKVCCPPTKIFQCPEGDLICEACRGGPGARLEICPACKVELAGMVSRNKVLEKIAKKYFICK